MRTGPRQVLAATLTLHQPEGADYAHPILNRGEYSVRVPEGPSRLSFFKI